MHQRCTASRVDTAIAFDVCLKTATAIFDSRNEGVSGEKNIASDDSTRNGPRLKYLPDWASKNVFEVTIVFFNM
jgi:hypothetical protein